MATDIGKAAYDGYCAAAGGRSAVSGDRELPIRQRIQPLLQLINLRSGQLHGKLADANRHPADDRRHCLGSSCPPQGLDVLALVVPGRQRVSGYWFSHPAREPSYIYAATVVRIFDGDTIRADIQLGFRLHADLDLRLFGCNARELAEPGGVEAQDHLVDLLICKSVTVQTVKPDKYGDRWLARVWLADGTELVAHLIAEGVGGAVGRPWHQTGAAVAAAARRRKSCPGWLLQAIRDYEIPPAGTRTPPGVT